jgi:spermidine dehydrogenase
VSGVADEKRDHELGMGRPVPRHDFLNGASVAIGASLVQAGSFGGGTLAETDKGFAPEKEPGYCPPGHTRMRSSHDGSWEMTHAMKDGKQWDNPACDPDFHDLIVVGGGMSSLSAAFFYRRQAGPKAKILTLDNDFGGHAKGNEFHTGSCLIIGHGGTQTITGPTLYSREAKQLFKDLGIAVKKFETFCDQEFYESRGMGQAIFFDKEMFGADKPVGRTQHTLAGFPREAPSLFSGPERFGTALHREGRLSRGHERAVRSANRCDSGRRCGRLK